MSAPEHPGLVLLFDAHSAPALARRGDRELEVLLFRKEAQLAAVIDTATTQALFMWLGQQGAPPTAAQIEARRQKIRAEWVGIALAADNRKGPKR